MTSDKHGQELQVGDTVELVYAGETALMLVDEVEQQVPNGPTPHLTGKILIRVPAGAVTLRAHAPQPAPEPRPHHPRRKAAVQK